MNTYSNSNDELLQEREGFNDRLNNFFSGELLPSKHTVDFDTGANLEQVNRRSIDELERAIKVLDDLDDDTPAEFITARFHMGGCGDEEVAEKIYDVPNFVSRYEKCFTRVRALEAQLENANVDQQPEILNELLEANAAFDIEKGRALDDRYRKFHLVDNWRNGEGRDDYNKKRRNTRDTANTSLKDMSEVERAAHRLAQKADSKWKSAKVKAGWTKEQIIEGMEKLIAKRQAKTACA